MGLTSLTGAFVVLTVLASGQARAADPVTERGLTHTSKGQDVVERAISRVGKLIGDAGPRLAPSWNMTADGAVGAVPVYLVEGRPGAIVTPAAVPSGCRCVFVSPSVLDSWISRNSMGAGRLSLDVENFLVFVLLHEVGHLKKATAGGAFRDGAMFLLNIEPSRAKVAEEEADNFAADTLKSWAKQDVVSDVSVDANWVVSELTKLSWNMQAFQTIDEFGSFSTGSPMVFFDNGYTHPNLAWRILRVNDRIQQSEETRLLLRVFEEARERGANPEPLYQRR